MADNAINIKLACSPQYNDSPALIIHGTKASLGVVPTLSTPQHPTVTRQQNQLLMCKPCTSPYQLCCRYKWLPVSGKVHLRKHCCIAGSVCASPCWCCCCAGAGLDIDGQSIEQKRLNAIRRLKAKVTGTTWMHSQSQSQLQSPSQSQLRTQPYSPADQASQSQGLAQLQSYVPVPQHEGPLQLSQGNCQQPLPAQGSCQPQGSSELRPQSQSHSRHSPALALPPASSSQHQLLSSQTHSQPWSQTLSPPSQISSGLSSASGSQTQPDSQLRSHPFTTSLHVQTPSPQSQTPLIHPTPLRPPSWSSPSLSPASSPPTLATSIQPQALSPAVSQAAPHAAPAQQASPGLHPDSRLLMPQPQVQPQSQPMSWSHSHSRSQAQSHSQSQVEPPSSTPVHIQAQLAGTGVFQTEQLHQSRLQQQVHLSPTQQQQQQQQSGLAGGASGFLSALNAGCKRSHEAMSAGGLRHIVP